MDVEIVTKLLDEPIAEPEAPEPLAYDVRPLYRVTKPIHYKGAVIPRGSLHRLEKVPPQGIERLKQRGTIQAVQPPPLSVLAGWHRRAERFAQAGIEDALQLLGVDVEQAAAYMNVKPATVRRWQTEVGALLKAPGRRG